MIAPMAFDNQALGRILGAHTKVIEGSDGFWHIEFQSRLLTIITDEFHDRMRVIAPIIEAKDVDSDLAMTLLQSNFDRALDARYAMTDDYLWSAFIHPLSPLSEPQVLSAIRQVATLADNFGSSFSSGELTFGGS